MDWEVSSVGSEFTIQLGKMLDAAKNVGIPKPYIGNWAVQWGQINLDGLATVPMTPSDLQRFRLQRGDLLVCEGGEIGRAAIWDDAIPECYYQKALHRLRPTRGYDVFLMMSLLQLWTSSGYLANYVTQTSIAHLPKDRFELVPLQVPPPAEQRAIAEALSDVDGLIEALDKLIAKKQAIKQATLQQLLTGKTRLPGFSGEWETKRIGDISTCLSTANNPRADLSDDGDVEYIHYGDIHAHAKPILDCRNSGLPRIDRERIGNAARLEDGDLVIVDASEDLEGVGKSFEVQGVAGRTIVAGLHTILCRGNPDHWAMGFKAYLQFIPAFKSALVRVATGISVYAVSKKQLAVIELALPPVREQQAIVAVVSDMDAEITALEQRRDKTKQIKQGMMQQLLTGKVRLLKHAASAVQVASAPQKIKAHNQQINDAVIISVLAKQFGSDQYPLGRMRYTKLSYLLHRYAGDDLEGYLKKAAGPYNPQTRYGGAEKIAIKNEYIRQRRRRQYCGFVAGDNIAQAEGYFDKWYGREARQWLERFRYMTNDELELLATVDMATEELRGKGVEVTVAAVKDVIKANEEWKAKLTREIFSDENIAGAIETCRRLFGQTDEGAP
jgi:type I restriction enzyme S subunit